MPFDSVFTAALEVPFESDRPLIPIADIEQGLDAIEDASIEQQTRILAEQTASLLQRAGLFLQARDVAGIQSLEWSAGVALQAPIFSVWSMGWQLGSAHMIREMVAAVPESERQKAEGRRFNTPHSPLLTFTTAQEKDEIAALLQLQPGTIVNTAAEQAVLRRVVQLSGNFSEAQLAKLKVSLIGAISPDADGKVLSRKELLDQVQANLQVGKARAEMIARTELTNAYNSSRIQTALQSSIVTHFRFLAISDARTTPICRSRNGMLIAASDMSAIAANKPPLHVRCRSTVSPVMGTINPTHAEWVADPARQPGNRTLEPLSKGWNSERPPIKIQSAPTITAEEQSRRSALSASNPLVERGRKLGAEIDDIGKRIGRVVKLYDDADTLEGKELQAAKGAARMAEIRQAMLERSPVSADLAKTLADRVTIPKRGEGSAFTKAEVTNIRGAIAEFFQLTGAKGSASLQKVAATKGQYRAFAEKENGLIDLGALRYATPTDPNAKKPLLFHELGHHVEFENLALAKQAKRWVRSVRTGDQQALSLLTGSNAYGEGETAYPDHFVAPYVGKFYDDATEVVSVGLEHFVDGRAMFELYRRDPEHFYLILGIIL